MLTSEGPLLHTLELIQAAQTAALVTVAVAVIYALALLRTELKKAATVLAEVIAGQKQLDENVRRSWEHIDAIEADLRRLASRDPPSSSP